MARYNPNNHAQNLPDCYRKTEDSNHFKILEIERLTGQELRQSLQNLSDSLDLEKAFGKTLDLYGDTVGQPRGAATDSQYVYMIKSRIMRNIANGSYPDIVRCICRTFGCSPSQVLIVEKEEPCVVELVVLPLDVINRAGLTVNQTVAMVRSLMPVCIRLERFNFEGTFEFSALDSEYDQDAGFADDEGTIGGALGLLLSIEDEIELPI